MLITTIARLDTSNIPNLIFTMDKRQDRPIFDWVSQLWVFLNSPQCERWGNNYIFLRMTTQGMRNPGGQAVRCLVRLRPFPAHRACSSYQPVGILGLKKTRPMIASVLSDLYQTPGKVISHLKSDFFNNPRWWELVKRVYSVNVSSPRQT